MPRLPHSNEETMPTQQSICAILNPAAGNGQAGREKYNIGQSLSKHFSNWTIWETQGPRHATALAKKAAEEGFDIVAAIGGDGSAARGKTYIAMGVKRHLDWLGIHTKIFNAGK